MAPYGSAIKAWPSGQIMATPMITRQFITVIGQARIARRAALKPVFSQLDPRLGSRCRPLLPFLKSILTGRFQMPRH
jgi:hypothetical protein